MHGESAKRDVQSGRRPLDSSSKKRLASGFLLDQPLPLAIHGVQNVSSSNLDLPLKSSPSNVKHPSHSRHNEVTKRANRKMNSQVPQRSGVGMTQKLAVAGLSQKISKSLGDGSARGISPKVSDTISPKVGVDSHKEPWAVRKNFLPSQQPGTSSLDERLGQGSSPQDFLKDFGTPKSKLVRGSESDTKSVKLQSQPEVEGSNEYLNVYRSKSRTPSKQVGGSPGGDHSRKETGTKLEVEDERGAAVDLPPLLTNNGKVPHDQGCVKNETLGSAARDSGHWKTPAIERRELEREVASMAKVFNFSWEASLKMALQQRRALLLQNLDPWFSSFEVEALLKELLHVGCDVRMLPPKDFACYTSGEALVIFKTQKAAEEALAKFTENILILSKDERPVIVTVAVEQTSKTSRFHGFFDSGTSHGAQPNTIEYEMGLEWRLLQNRHTEAWSLAAQEHEHGFEADDMVLDSKL